MTLEQQVCSLDLAKRLKELGVKQDGYWTWLIQKKAFTVDVWTEPELVHLKTGWGDAQLFSAFTVAEIGEMLPSSMRFPFANGRLRAIKQHLHIFKGWDDKGWLINYTAAGTRRLETIKADTEADARAKMLIYLLENKLITL